METTRRHPRSLAEAFPQDRAQWMEGPEYRLRWYEKAGVIVAVVALFAVAAAVVIVKGRA